MSADNWDQCPACLKRWEEEVAAAKEVARNSYGKVPSDKYERLRQAPQKIVLPEESLREDYGIGINSKGLFWVTYSAECRCGYKYKFDYQYQVAVTTSASKTGAK